MKYMLHSLTGYGISDREPLTQYEQDAIMTEIREAGYETKEISDLVAEVSNGSEKMWLVCGASSGDVDRALKAAGLI